MTLRPLQVMTAVAGFCLGTALVIPAPADAAGKNKKHHVRVGGPARRGRRGAAGSTEPVRSIIRRNISAPTRIRTFASSSCAT